jgi:hypothetical protein
VTLILLGRTLEARAKGRTGRGDPPLMGLAPKTALVLRDGTPEETPVDAILPGDLIRVRPGERLAVDGEVTEGASPGRRIHAHRRTRPVEKDAGAEVTGGTVNGTGSLTFRATRVGRDTTLSQIIRMVEQAQSARLPIQSLVNRITAVFVPVVMAIAALTVAVWLILGPEPALTHALVAGVSVLIIACPCAMGLATPTSIMVGTGRAADLGVLFRKGDALQSLHEARTVVAFDKTGTLTEGRPELVALVPAAGLDRGSASSPSPPRSKPAPNTPSPEPSPAPPADPRPDAARARHLRLHHRPRPLRPRGGPRRPRRRGRLMEARRHPHSAPSPAAGEAQAAKGRTPLFAAIDGTGRRPPRRGRPGQARHAGRHRGASRPGARGRDDHRRQPPHGRGHRRRPRDRPASWPR